MDIKEKTAKRIKRKKRTGAKIFGTNLRPRVSVFVSNKHIYAQIIDDEAGRTLVSANDSELDKSSGVNPKKTSDKVKNKTKEVGVAKDSLSASVLAKKENKSKIGIAAMVGELLAKKAGKKKIKSVVFDRGGRKYHGKVKALAEGLRKGGLKF